MEEMYFLKLKINKGTYKNCLIVIILDYLNTKMNKKINPNRMYWYN